MLHVWYLKVLEVRVRSCKGCACWDTVALRRLLVATGVLTAAASRIGPVTSASHHVVISIYMFFCMCGDAVSQAAQSFLPGVVRLTARTSLCSWDTAVHPLITPANANQ